MDIEVSERRLLYERHVVSRFPRNARSAAARSDSCRARHVRAGAKTCGDATPALARKKALAGRLRRHARTAPDLRPHPIQPHAVLQRSLLLDSRVFTDQQLHERTQQRFASLADVVHKLEEPQVEREFLLGNAPMRAQPTPQERPEAFHGVYVHFAKAVPVFISGKLASPMVDTLMS